MPDLTIINQAVCVTALRLDRQVAGSTGNMYWVSYGPTPKGPHQFGWSCGCKAFEFGGGKPCRHIKMVSPSRCGWQGPESLCRLDVKHKPYKKLCPKCGNDITYVPTGV